MYPRPADFTLLFQAISKDMKTIIIQVLISTFVLAMIFSSCEKIEAPYFVYEEKDTIPPDTIPPDTTKLIKKVLLEDYTGHTCVNCAEAGFIAHDLQEIYGEQLIVMAVHAGFFALPRPGDPYLSDDFRCDAGNAWNNYFGVGSAGNPNGIVNRVPSSPGNYIVAVDKWDGAIHDELEKEPVAGMTIENDFKAGSKILTTVVTTKFVEELEGTFSLLVCITQDSIISGQMNNDPNVGDTPLIEEYVFMHMLEGSMNGDWGEVLIENPVVDQEYEKTYSITFEDDWVPKNCHVVAFVFDEDLKTILQVEELAVLEE